MLSPTLLLATTLKFSLQLGGRRRAGGSTWRSLSGCSQQQQVKSVPDMLYHPPETSQLSQACAPCASPPRAVTQGREQSLPHTLLLHAQPRPCSLSPNTCYSQHCLKSCREIFPAPPDSSETWMFAQPV